MKIMETSFKYCVRCGNTEGFPETENQKAEPHICFDCEEIEGTDDDD